MGARIGALPFRWWELRADCVVVKRVLNYRLCEIIIGSLDGQTLLLWYANKLSHITLL